MKEFELEGKSKSKPLPLDSGKSFDVTLEREDRLLRQKLEIEE